MPWSSSLDDAPFVPPEAALAALTAAAAAMRLAAQRAPEVVATTRWRSPAFDAFRARTDLWREDVERLERHVRFTEDDPPRTPAPRLPWLRPIPSPEPDR